LQANQILNDKFEFCTNIRAAASDVDGVGLLELSPDNFGDHRVRSAEIGDGSGLYDEKNRSVSETRLMRIDTLLEEYGLAPQDLGLVWIDTQGHEGHALAGAQQLISAKVPIVAEFWPYGLQRSGGYELLRRSLERAAGIYDLEKFKQDGDKTRLDVEDLDRMFSDILDGESESRASFTDIVVVFEG
jgi:FkbM family methyltransferase